MSMLLLEQTFVFANDDMPFYSSCKFSIVKQRNIRITRSPRKCLMIF